MVDERQQKPADQPTSSVEIEEVSESRTDDDSKTLIRPDRTHFREGYSPMTDPGTCQMLNQIIVKATKSAISEVVRELSDRIKDSLLEAINKAIDEGVEQTRTEVEEVISEQVEKAERRCELKTMSAAELFEFYKWQENIRIVGVNQNRSSDSKVSESYSQSIQNVLKLAENVGANIA